MLHKEWMDILNRRLSLAKLFAYLDTSVETLIPSIKWFYYLFLFLFSTSIHITERNTLENRATNDDGNNRQTMPPLVQLDSDTETRRSEKLESSYMRRRLRYWRSLLEQGSALLGFCKVPLHIISLAISILSMYGNFVTELCRWWKRHRSIGERKGGTKTNYSFIFRFEFFLWGAGWSRAG